MVVVVVVIALVRFNGSDSGSGGGGSGRGWLQNERKKVANVARYQLRGAHPSNKAA